MSRVPADAQSQASRASRASAVPASSISGKFGGIQQRVIGCQLDYLAVLSYLLCSPTFYDLIEISLWLRRFISLFLTCLDDDRPLSRAEIRQIMVMLKQQT